MLCEKLALWFLEEQVGTESEREHHFCMIRGRFIRHRIQIVSRMTIKINSLRANFWNIMCSALAEAFDGQAWCGSIRYYLYIECMPQYG
jgi:hypothetical protein